MLTDLVYFFYLINHSFKLYSTPVTQETYWEVQQDQFVVNGKKVGTSFGAAIDTGKSFRASTSTTPYWPLLLDLGTTLIYTPSTVAKAIVSQKLVESFASRNSKSDHIFSLW